MDLWIPRALAGEPQGFDPAAGMSAVLVLWVARLLLGILVCLFRWGLRDFARNLGGIGRFSRSRGVPILPFAALGVHLVCFHLLVVGVRCVVEGFLVSANGELRVIRP